MESYIAEIAEKGLEFVLILSAPPVLTAMCVGLFVSLLQATTQVQEQTLTFVPKLVAIILILIFFGQTGMDLLRKFTEELFISFPEQVNLLK